MNAMPTGTMSMVQAPEAHSAQQVQAQPASGSRAEAYQWVASLMEQSLDVAHGDAASELKSFTSEVLVDAPASEEAGVDADQMLSMQWHMGQELTRLQSSSSASRQLKALTGASESSESQDVEGVPSIWMVGLSQTSAPLQPERAMNLNVSMAESEHVSVRADALAGHELTQAMGVVQPRSTGAAAVSAAGQLSAESLSVRQPPQALVQALAQRIQVQQVQGVDVATVRLDPPDMGGLEIRIRQDASGVHVQMHASNAEVGRQLASVVEGLRSELQQRTQEATVTVANSRFSQQSGEHKQRQQHSQQAHDELPVIGHALQT